MVPQIAAIESERMSVIPSIVKLSETNLSIFLFAFLFPPLPIDQKSFSRKEKRVLLGS